MVWSANIGIDVFGVQATVHTMQPYGHMIIVEDPLELLARGCPLPEVMDAVFTAMGTAMFGLRATLLLFDEDGSVQRVWHSGGTDDGVRSPGVGTDPAPVRSGTAPGGTSGDITEAWRVRYDATWATELVSGGRVTGVVLVWTAGCRPPIYLRERIHRVLRVAQLAIERDRAEQRLQRLAIEDPLTGLINRREFMATLQQRLADGPVGVVFADLDTFKPINDRFGHLVGDEVLRMIGARLQRIAGTRSTASRLGGDEFAILASPAGVDRIAIAVQRSVGRPIMTSAGRLQVGTSVGVAVAARGASPWSVLDAADRAMFQDKRSRSTALRPVQA
jgi:diguanylate cyclase (GGDEF)-like protein